ncbi:MAG: insulinase family protein [Chloracidobacterium sp.]|nr:insulinase family protein [Chloracidobacterium sp.]MDW8216958.1 pitrilysin family protein [Acidobacteriota bacterium]
MKKAIPPTPTPDAAPHQASPYIPAHLTTPRRAPARRGRHQTKLPNGLSVIVEPMAHVRSVALSVWSRIGARHEPALLNGVSHFVEHMLFKGTERRTTRQIAVESDRLGGQVDAATMMEGVNYHIQTLDLYWSQALDLLADLVCAPRFDETEFQRERAVILEEMKMIADNPEELIFERFLANFFPNHALGRPIEGTPRTLRRLTPADLRRFHQFAYHPSQLVLSVAGHVNPDDLLEAARAYFGDAPQPPEYQEVEPYVGAPTFCLNHERDVEQAHLLLGLPAPPLLSPHRTASTLLTTLLGGGLSSRLFLRIREEAGLAYNIYADTMAYRDAGVLLIYAAVAPRHLKRTVQAIIREVAAIAQGDFTPEEVELAKAQHLTNLHLGHDAAGVRANQNGYQEITFGQIFSNKTLEREIKAVTHADLQHLAQATFAGRTFSGLALGPLGRFGLQPDWLHIPRHVSRSTVHVTAELPDHKLPDAVHYSC